MDYNVPWWAIFLATIYISNAMTLARMGSRLERLTVKEGDWTPSVGWMFAGMCWPIWTPIYSLVVIISRVIGQKPMEK